MPPKDAHERHADSNSETEELMGLESHVRDESRFKGGWGFFAASGDGTAALIPTTAPCCTCHQAHGAVDTTFTHFYPLAKPFAEKAGNFRNKRVQLSGGPPGAVTDDPG
jgi:hypothetical protein